MKTQITFLFESVNEARVFLDELKGAPAGATPATPTEVIPAAVEAAPVVPGQPQGIISPAAAIPAISESAPNELAPPQAVVGKITGKMISDALRDYKAAHGHPAYKALLGEFGVSTQRDIPKNRYAEVLEKAKGAAPAPVATETAPGAPVVPANILPATGGTPTTTEDLRAALSNHKARFGMEATKALLASAGYPDPNQIPEAQYGEIVERLNNDDPTAAGDTGLGFALSEF